MKGECGRQYKAMLAEDQVVQSEHGLGLRRPHRTVTFLAFAILITENIDETILTSEEKKKTLTGLANTCG